MKHREIFGRFRLLGTATGCGPDIGQSRRGRSSDPAAVTPRTSSVRLPRLKRRRYTAKLVLTDPAKNRSKVRKIRFRVR